MEIIKKKSSKIMSIVLAAALSCSILPTTSNCGFLNFIQKNKHGFLTAGHCILALTSFLAFTSKDLKKTKTALYTGTLGACLLGLGEAPRIINSIKVFSKSSKYYDQPMMQKPFTFMEGLQKLFEVIGALKVILWGPAREEPGSSLPVENEQNTEVEPQQ